MPKPREVTVPYLKIKRLIKSYGLSANRISPVLGCCPHTAKLKLDNPEKFTLDDLDRLSNYYEIPWEDFKDAMVR